VTAWYAGPEGHIPDDVLIQFDSPDDEHWVAQNMQRREINKYIEKCASCWLLTRIRSLCDIRHFCHMSLPTFVTVSTLYSHMTSTLTYMICVLCHMLIGVICNIYCKCKYCTFTWTSILAYPLLLICWFSSISNTMKPLTEKIYDQGKFVQDMTYLNMKSEEP